MNLKMQKFLIFDKNEFYGKHIANKNDIIFKTHKEINEFSSIHHYNLLYLVYEDEDFYQSLQLNSELFKKIEYVLMDKKVKKKKFKRNLKTKLYNYIEAYHLLNNRILNKV